MKDVSGDSFRILAVADINGAKKYMDEDGLIGLAHYLRNLPDSSKPDMFVINGGILPEVPVKGGPRNDDRQRVLADGVVDLSGAAAVVKPHIQRIFAALPETTEVIYVKGASDQINIDNLKSYYNGLYLSAKRTFAKAGEVNLFSLMNKEIEAGISSKEDMGRAMKESLAVLQEQLAAATSDKDGERLAGEIKRTTANLKLHREEIHELQEKRTLLRKLEAIVKTAVEPDVWQKKIAAEQKKLNRITKKLEKLKEGKTGADYEKLSEEAKHTSNKLRQLGHRLTESIERSGFAERDLVLGTINAHNGRIPVPPDVNEILTKLVNLEYNGNIKDALGRKRNVRIQEEKLEVYTRSVSGYSFNVLLADSMNLQTAGQSYIRSSNSKFAGRVYTLLNDSGSVRNVETSETAVAISGGHGFTSFSVDPLRDQSETLIHLLAKGPMLNTELTAAFWNRGVKTKETVAANQGILDSGVSIIDVFSGGQVNHTTIKQGMLHDERVESDREEAASLEKVVALAKAGKGKALGAENPELTRAMIGSKRPSEILKEEIPFTNEQLLRSTVPNVDAPAPTAPDKVRIALITDVHMASYGDLELLDAAVKDALAGKPNILALGGDNIEGNLRNHKHEPRPENEYGVMEQFRQWLDNRGLDELSVLRILDDRRAKQSTYEVTNIDEQGKIFADRISPLVIDIIKRGGYIWIASGNHYNGTHNDSQHDEATVLEGAIKLMLAGHAADLPENWQDQIKTVRGGKYSEETFKLGEMTVELRHALEASVEGMIAAEEKKRTSSGLVLTGHYHSTREASNINTEIVEGPTMQLTATSPHVKTIYVPLEPRNMLMGYLNIDASIKGDRLVESTVEPRLRKQLGVDDALWTQFLRDKKSMEIPKEKTAAKVPA